MKLYIASSRDDGRSYVESATEMEDKWSIHVWDGALDDMARTISSMAPGAHGVIEPPPGGIRWVHVRFPPDSEAEAWGYNDIGFHRTRTVDFDHLLSGELNCVLDEGTIELDAGDFIILRTANHRWANRGDGVATLLCLLHQPVVP
jgi:hypothetical protein